jgi:hypothetical protein
LDVFRSILSAPGGKPGVIPLVINIPTMMAIVSIYVGSEPTSPQGVPKLAKLGLEPWTWGFAKFSRLNAGPAGAALRFAEILRSDPHWPALVKVPSTKTASSPCRHSIVCYLLRSDQSHPSKPRIQPPLQLRKHRLGVQLVEQLVVKPLKATGGDHGLGRGG